MKRNKGFTLIELLAVIVILALIMILVTPSILEIMNKSKKDAFFMYAESLQSKALNAYVSTSNSEIDTQTCSVYDIRKDLDIKNTGDFDGWVKVTRVATSESGEKKVTIDLSDSRGIKYPRYCITKDIKCSPDTTYNSNESKNVSITKLLPEGYTLCANYQYEKDGSLSTPSTIVCKSTSSGVAVNTTYDYNIYMVLTNRTYTFEGQFNKNQFNKNEFEKKLGFFSESGISITDCDNNKLVKGATTSSTTIITKPSTTTAKKECKPLTDDEKFFNINFNSVGGSSIGSIRQCVDCDYSVKISEPEKEGYTFLGWFYDKEYTKPLENVYSFNIVKELSYDATGCLMKYNDITLYAKWYQGLTSTSTNESYIVSTTTTTTGQIGVSEVITNEQGEVVITSNVVTEPSTTDLPTTTIDINDTSLLLDSLSVPGYNLGFTPTKFYYDITVLNDVTNLSVYARPYDNNTKYEIKGNNSLSVGKNNLEITLTNLDGKVSNYLIRVDRLNAAGQSIGDTGNAGLKPGNNQVDPDDPSSDASLKSIGISGYIFEFDKDKYEYDLQLYAPGDLVVTALPTNSKAIVSITGTTDVKDGSVINITVTSQNGYYTKNYKIKAHEQKKTSTNTKVLRAIIIALLVLLITCLVIIKLNKMGKINLGKKKVKVNAPSNDASKQTESGLAPQESSISQSIDK